MQYKFTRSLPLLLLTLAFGPRASAQNLYPISFFTDRIFSGNATGAPLQELPLNFNGNLKSVEIDRVNQQFYLAEADYPGANPFRLLRTSFNGTGTQVMLTLPIESYSYDVGLRLDAANGKLYFADHDSWSILSVNLDGTGLDTVYTFPNWTNVLRLEIDPAAGKIYMVRTSSPAIHVADLDNPVFTPLVQTTNGANWIRLNPADGKLYWSESTFSGDQGSLHRINTDGTGVEKFYETDSEILGFDFDTPNNRIYFALSNEDKVAHVGFDGTGYAEAYTVPSWSGVDHVYVQTASSPTSSPAAGLPVRIFPNPTTDRFSFEGASLDGAAELFVYDPAGRLVYSATVDAASALELPLRPGVYRVDLTDGKVRYSGRLVRL
jgi:hypothetical protein